MLRDEVERLRHRRGGAAVEGKRLKVTRPDHVSREREVAQLVLYQDIADTNRFRTSLTLWRCALERAATHESEAGVHRESQSAGSEHLRALRRVRNLSADGLQVAAALSGRGVHGLGRAEPP